MSTLDTEALKPSAPDRAQLEHFLARAEGVRASLLATARHCIQQRIRDDTVTSKLGALRDMITDGQLPTLLQRTPLTLESGTPTETTDAVLLEVAFAAAKHRLQLVEALTGSRDKETNDAVWLLLQMAQIADRDLLDLAGDIADPQTRDLMQAYTVMAAQEGEIRRRLRELNLTGDRTQPEAETLEPHSRLDVDRGVRLLEWAKKCGMPVKQTEDVPWHAAVWFSHVATNTARVLAHAIPLNALGLSEEDLESVGILALREAAARFDPARGVSFGGTFALKRVRGAMYDEIRGMNQFGRLTVRIAAALTQEDMGLSSEDIAAKHGCTRDIALSARRLANRAKDVSLDKTVYATDSGQKVTMEDNFEGCVPDPDSRTDRVSALEKILRSCNPVETLVVVLYYYCGWSMREIGECVDLSESRISQIHSRLIDRLKDSLPGNFEEDLTITRHNHTLLPEVEQIVAASCAKLGIPPPPVLYPLRSREQRLLAASEPPCPFENREVDRSYEAGEDPYLKPLHAVLDMDALAVELQERNALFAPTSRDRKPSPLEQFNRLFGNGHRKNGEGDEEDILAYEPNIKLPFWAGRPEQPTHRLHSLLLDQEKEHRDPKKRKEEVFSALTKDGMPERQADRAAKAILARSESARYYLRKQIINLDRPPEIPGKIVKRPTFWRTLERERLLAPNLDALLEAHFKAHPKPREERVLIDVGALNGALAKLLRSHFGCIVAIESDRRRFNLLQQSSSSRFIPVRADIRDIVADPASFSYTADVVLLSHVLYFVNLDEDEQILRWAQREALMPGGISLTVLNDPLRKPGSRTHLRHTLAGREWTPVPHLLKEFLEREGSPVQLVRPTLRFQSRTSDGLTATRDIMRYHLPEGSRSERALDEYIQRYIVGPPDRAAVYDHTVSILVAHKTQETYPIVTQPEFSDIRASAPACVIRMNEEDPHCKRLPQL